MAKQNKVKIFDALKAVNRKDYNYFLTLSDEQAKSLAPYVMMRWMVGAQDSKPAHVILTNEFVNQLIFQLNDTRLMYLLLCEANGGMGDTYYSYDKPNNTGKHTKRITMISEYYQCTVNEANDYVELLSNEDLFFIGDELGYSDKDLERIVNYD